jgi:hypothetical protein
MSVEPIDLDSTLMRKGVRAASYSDMAEFAQTVETRPLDKLLAELPAIATLSETKFLLARAVMRRRARALSAVEHDQLRIIAAEIAAELGSELGGRIRDVFV